MRFGGVGEVDERFAVFLDAVEEYSDLAVEGVVRDVAIVGADGRDGDPIGLTGDELLRLDAVVTFRSIAAQIGLIADISTEVL